MMIISSCCLLQSTKGLGVCDCELKMTAHGIRREDADEDERAAHKRTSVPQINNNSQPEPEQSRLQRELVVEVRKIPCVHGEQRTHSIEEFDSLVFQVQRARFTAYGFEAVG